MISLPGHDTLQLSAPEVVSSAIGIVGQRLPRDVQPRSPLVYHFGLARRLHLGDYLGVVAGLRALAADPSIDLFVTVEGELDDARHLAASLIACGLGSVSFLHSDPLAPNHFAGQTVANLPTGTAVADLREPRLAMGRAVNDQGVVYLLDSALVVAAAVRNAVLDLDPMLGYDPQLRPGIANLATILGALTNRSPIVALSGLHGATALRQALTQALLQHWRPVHQAYQGLATEEVLPRLVLSA